MSRRIATSIPMLALAAVVLAGCAKSGAAASGGANPLVVQARSVSGVGTVLVSTPGLTLYHLAGESASKITCTGQCASVWPPFLLPASNSGASAGSGVSGSFGTVQRPDGGTQITFDGMPLYTYVGDTAPGQAKGQNLNGFVGVSATGSGAGGTSASPTSGGGYGGGGY
jgi:predicted lipoprotein with Yx(FWY)xxD motif